MTALRTVQVGDRALRFEIPSGTPRAALLEWLLEQPGVVDASLAAEHALAVFEGPPSLSDLPVLEASTAHEAREHVVHVVYDGDDLAEVAASLALTPEAVIVRHTARPLEVAFLGFCPGFAYLRGLDDALAAVARHDVPRVRVPAGAVAIAGGYAGIYPAAMPGGWRLLGHALDAHLLDGETPRLRVGDRVRFVATDPRRHA